MLLGRQRYGRATVSVRRKPAAGDSENRSISRILLSRCFKARTFLWMLFVYSLARHRHCEDRS
jgi:hypothetical protein